MDNEIKNDLKNEIKETEKFFKKHPSGSFYIPCESLLKKGESEEE